MPMVLLNTFVLKVKVVHGILSDEPYLEKSTKKNISPKEAFNLFVLI